MKIVSRAEWGARAPRQRSMNDWPNGVDLWVHHTSGPQSQSVKSIQDFHMNGRGWSDIGYNYLIDFDGQVFEGRGLNVHGAHSPGKNHEPAVSLIGDYSSIHPSDFQRGKVWELAEFLKAGRLRGHRENTATTCPGNAAFKDIVKSPPPDVIKPTHFYYFEELPHDEGGAGPKIVGQVTGYKIPRRAWDAKVEQDKLGRATSLLRSGDGEEDHTFILWWAADTFGKPYRFGPWIEEGARDIQMAARQVNQKRVMRKFEGRSRSLYPWPDA